MTDKYSFMQRFQAAIQPHRIVSVLFLVAILSLSYIFYRSVAPGSRHAETEIVQTSGELEVFFSAPDDPASKTLRGGPDALLAASIARAQHSVDVAAYNLDLWSIRDALLEAQRSGALVRVVVEGGNFGQREIQDLMAAQIEVVPDGDQGLMHHKFVVIDQLDVWTGSMNLTLNGAYRNDNNLLHIQSRRLAQDFVREFDEMFVEGRFGQLSLSDTPFPEIEVGQARVAVYFSPDDHALAGIMRTLNGAKKQVLVMAYTLTQDELASLLAEHAKRGLDVRVVLEGDQVQSTGNDFVFLQENGVSTIMDANPNNMHHKVIMIDGEIVITGSYNFTRSAEERNDENLLIIDDQALAEQYLVEFTRIWEAAGR